MRIDIYVREVVLGIGFSKISRDPTYRFRSCHKNKLFQIKPDPMVHTARPVLYSMHAKSCCKDLVMTPEFSEP